MGGIMGLMQSQGRVETRSQSHIGLQQCQSALVTHPWVAGLCFIWPTWPGVFTYTPLLLVASSNAAQLCASFSHVTDSCVLEAGA
jgi:hypothetical protein